MNNFNFNTIDKMTVIGYEWTNVIMKPVLEILHHLLIHIFSLDFCDVTH